MMTAAHLGHSHQGWHNAIHICTSVGQGFFLVCVPVDGLQGLIQGLEL